MRCHGDFVRPGLGNNADHACTIATVFRGIVAGQNAELSDRIRVSGSRTATIIDEIVVDTSIQQVGDGIGASMPATLNPWLALVSSWDYRRSRPAAKEHKGENIASVQRHVNRWGAQSLD